MPWGALFRAEDRPLTIIGVTPESFHGLIIDAAPDVTVPIGYSGRTTYRERKNLGLDVFALGSILCEVLTGRPAFTGRTVGEIHRKAVRGDLAEACGRLARRTGHGRRGAAGRGAAAGARHS